MKILMVCLGNICRSPLAEGILRKKVEEHQLDWVIDSAGTSSFHSGDKPDRRSIKIAKEHDIDISKQRSRVFRAYDLEEFDIIYAMDSANYQDIIRHTQSEKEQAKVKLIMNELEPGMNINVPDPYYGEFGFQNVFGMLDKACDVIVESRK